ncbi:uncharacterized protein BO80DRAFT_450760 [Aspergillus ibericus CBS 121593]|uniref:MADS-box domain-containing protein n=1 Tax=Aspergillus ibericus CBS 121593 TaxID=1448316 RepID=A0A395GI23_9EURO|nr:hypothetical protein BO80DRAFT_450760 [Aspergillus ibericus CBS 121593]RAK94826.1 hypothetical protein BO80DRAFT_450760 [Aspergillus ibericus CBS 121593]
MSKQSPWVKKRHVETARAKSQQRQRRKKSLFKKAAEFSLECDSDVFVAVRIRKTGQIYYLDSSSLSQWINTLSNLESYYPSPIQEIMEDIIPQVEPFPEPGGTPATPKMKNV